MSRQRGIALLLVLWVLALLSALLAALVATVQLQQRQAAWSSGQTRALFAAQAGLGQAVIALQAREPQERWAADGQVHGGRFADAEVDVRLRSERGKLDLNAAPESAVRRLLQAYGAGAQEAARVGQALVQLRNGPIPLRSLEAFRELPGMTWPLYRQVLPLITVWSGLAEPDPSLAPPRLLRALGMPQVQASSSEAGQIFTVDSRARLPTGERARLRVTLILISAKEGARPYRVLRWQE